MMLLSVVFCKLKLYVQIHNSPIMHSCIIQPSIIFSLTIHRTTIEVTGGLGDVSPCGGTYPIQHCVVNQMQHTGCLNFTLLCCNSVTMLCYNV